MIFKLFLTLFLISLFLFLSFGVKAGFSHKVRLLIRLGLVALLVVVVLVYFGRKIF